MRSSTILSGKTLPRSPALGPSTLLGWNYGTIHKSKCVCGNMQRQRPHVRPIVETDIYIPLTRNLKLRPRVGESLPSFGMLVAHSLSPNWDQEAAYIFGGQYSAASSLSNPSAAAAIAEIAGLPVADLLPCRVVRNSGSPTVSIGPFVVAAEHASGSVRRLSPRTLAADAKQGRDPYHHRSCPLGWCSSAVAKPLASAPSTAL